MPSLAFQAGRRWKSGAAKWVRIGTWVFALGMVLGRLLSGVHWLTDILGICSFGIALVIFVFTYFLYHHLSPDGIFAAIYQLEPVKPFITLLFGIWGVTFLFASVFSFLVGLVFFRKK